jgi:hypothetical protein
VAITAFLTFVVFLGAVWVFLESAQTIAEHIDLVPVFTGVEIHNKEIFINMCQGQKRVQDCTQQEKENIYGISIPSNAVFEIAAYLEESLTCSGFNVALNSFYFTDR